MQHETILALLLPYFTANQMPQLECSFPPLAPVPVTDYICASRFDWIIVLFTYAVIGQMQLLWVWFFESQKNR